MGGAAPNLTQIRALLPVPTQAEERFVPNVAWDVANALAGVRAAIKATDDSVELMLLFRSLHPLMYEMETLTHAVIAKAVLQLKAQADR